jgi:hypothetical protein
VVPPHRRGLQGPGNGRGGGGDVRRSRRPMAHGGSPAGECARAAWHRTKPFTRVIILRCTVAAAQASDRGVSRRLGVRARAGYGGADVACPGATSCAGARFCKVSLTYPFCTRIFSRFQNRSGPNFEYQSCPSSYHLQKCQRI